MKASNFFFWSSPCLYSVPCIFLFASCRCVSTCANQSWQRISSAFSKFLTKLLPWLKKAYLFAHLSTDSATKKLSYHSIRKIRIMRSALISSQRAQKEQWFKARTLMKITTLFVIDKISSSNVNNVFAVLAWLCNIETVTMIRSISWHTCKQFLNFFTRMAGAPSVRIVSQTPSIRWRFKK